MISIHAPRTGSDDDSCHVNIAIFHFNRRSPHGERQGLTLKAVRKEIFQSTLPARGATSSDKIASLRRTISIHAPRTGSDAKGRTLEGCAKYFNPRSPHGERLSRDGHKMSELIFQSTLPARGATFPGWFSPIRMGHFNPRSPHGERHETLLQRGWFTEISIHAPRTGSDSKARERIIDGEISIHAPRTGSDLMLSGYFYSHYNFNPRSPHGERRRRATD